ncbi:MAG TPA: alkaline phosphatase family protein [Thermoleophilaceae bacterium]|jgi:phospholipase C
MTSPMDQDPLVGRDPESEEALSRRDFLERTAYAAGLAGAATLPAGMLLREAAAAHAKRVPLPRPRNMPIDHFVIVMMENRSFDHYFGWLSGVADATQKASYRDPATGQMVATRHASQLEAPYQGCGHPDPGHSWDDGRAQLKDGFLAEDSGNDEFALTYYNEGDCGFIHPLGKAYTLYDRFFCSALTSTWPNRYFKWSAQAGGRKNNTPPADTLGNQWETIFDRALASGLTARYYNSDLPFSAVWGARGGTWTHKLERFYVDCATGTLPNVAIVDPPFRDGGGGQGMSADEHPHGDVRLGQAWMSDVVHAFIASPNYRNGALFLVYDEWGGFWDHVRPPRVPDVRASRDPAEDWGQMGFRIPAVAVSPYSRRGREPRARVSHATLGFESIIKLITYRFGLGNLTVRDRYAKNVGRTFDWSRPDFEPPDLPDPAQVASSPCPTGGDQTPIPQTTTESRLEHEGDLAALEGLAERHGVPVGDGKVSDLFTKPDALRRAVRRGRVSRSGELRG